MNHFAILFALIVTLLTAPAAQAQQQIWLQIEAQPTLAEAEARARAYTGVFPDVAGFGLKSGWYAIALGPYSAAEAPRKLRELVREGMVPADSYLSDGASYRTPFWPKDGTGDTAGSTVAPVETAPLPETGPLPETDDPLMAANPDLIDDAEPAVETPVIIPDETPAAAKRAESALGREDRQALQTALQWFGFYAATIDGAFGPGTRKSMAAWQQAQGLDPTGVLTTAQRAALLAAYGTAQAELGLQTVSEPESGIEITLPMALVEFDHYEPPFVHYRAKDGSGVKVTLISEPGDQATLYGLYDVMQTLADVPLQGERDRKERSFTINAASATVQSHIYAELSKGLIKGYMLVWQPKDAEKMARVLAAMQSSFKPVGERALDPGLVPMAESTRKGLLSGLEIRRPTQSRSGFFVDASGSVITSAAAVAQCGRITINRDYDATIVLNDAASGIAVLKPVASLAPIYIAGLQTAPARLGGEIAVAGYSYEDSLPAPVLTFGTFEDDKGLDGTPGVARLTITTLPGDEGGPVLDNSGAVVGMLLPPLADPSRKLPPDVAFAASAAALSSVLAQAGITAPPAATAGGLAPEDLTGIATGMTVLVSCWN